MDTLTAVLGSKPGTKAKTFKNGIWTTVEQHKHNYGALYWIHYDSFDNIRLYDFWFDNMASILPDVNEPIWMQA